MKRILALILALASSGAVYAQKQVDPEPPRLVENIDVRVINVDVVVTDRKGNPVRGLTQDDFELLENNVPKTISNFYEVEGGTPKNVVGETPAPELAPGAKQEIPESLKRRIVFYVDNLSLAPFNRNRVFEQMKKFVNDAMRPGDEAMIATYNRSMKVRVPFTRDKNAIISMLDSLRTESGLGVAAKSEWQTTQDRIRDAQSYDEASAQARTYAQSVEHDLRTSVASLNALMSTLAGIEGKKVLVLTSEGFPMQPGREAYYFIEEVAKDKGWNNGGTLLEGMTFDDTTLVQSVGRTANANNITLYTIHAGGLIGSNDMSAERQQPISYAVTSAAMQNTTESMQLMAEMTGGEASVQTNNFAAAFQRIQRDLESYYSLGYRAGTERVDRQRYLRVRVKNHKDYTVRNRQTFVEKSVFAEMSDRVIANLLYSTKDNDLKLLARVGRPRPTDDGLYKVPVDVQIPMDSLTFVPQGTTEFAGGFDLYVAVANKNNDMSDVARKTHQIHVPAADMKSTSGKYYTYSLELLMEKGLNKISIGVIDSVSNTTGFRREQIIAQD
ncbi:MAG: VWA domain-containing protein [Acidobacteria bacterium]|nr:VWA domain-containing protein [Acidobacteriota bacterium]MBV9476517.1 VWA domain-containing protein [Acidobacteriota bacterium]